MPSFPSFLLSLSLLVTFSLSQSATLASPALQLSQSADPCPELSDGAASSCPVNCFRLDPVCGANGVTYWCGCPEAACAGVQVAKRGFCEVPHAGAGPVSGQALLLVHILWLFVLGFAVLFGFLWFTRLERFYLLVRFSYICSCNREIEWNSFVYVNIVHWRSLHIFILILYLVYF